MIQERRGLWFERIRISLLPPIYCFPPHSIDYLHLLLEHTKLQAKCGIFGVEIYKFNKKIVVVFLHTVAAASFNNVFNERNMCSITELSLIWTDRQCVNDQPFPLPGIEACCACAKAKDPKRTKQLMKLIILFK